jgi:hypothetical protein
MIALPEGFMFKLENGCLFHPNGYDTSWMTLRNDKWVPEEWAAYLEPEFAKRLLTIINEAEAMKRKLYLISQPKKD